MKCCVLCPDVNRRSLQRDFKIMIEKELIATEGATNQLVYLYKELNLRYLMTKTCDKLMTRFATSAKPVQMFKHIIEYPRMSPASFISVLGNFIF